MKRTLTGACIALFCWALIVLAMPFAGPSGRTVAVVGKQSEAVRAITAAGGQIVAVRRNAVLAISERPGFILSLYREGAPLVIEGRIAVACFSPVSRLER